MLQGFPCIAIAKVYHSQPNTALGSRQSKHERIYKIMSVFFGKSFFSVHYKMTEDYTVELSLTDRNPVQYVLSTLVLFGRAERDLEFLFC